MAQTLGLLDYAVLGTYFVVTLAVGLYVGRRIQTGSDYFLAGRQLPWWAIGLSLVATDIGGTDVIGVGGAAYRYGLAVGNFEWIGCVPAMIVAAFVFVPFFWRTGVYTIPELMERRFNVGVRSALAACWLVFMSCNLGIMLLAAGKLMVVLLGWDMAASIWITAVLVGAYTISGGLAAVVYTDVIQCVVMIGGCLAVLVVGLYQVGGPVGLRQQLVEAARAQAERQVSAEAGAGSAEAGAAAEAAARLRREYTSLVLPVDTRSPFPWPGILFGLALVMSPAYWIGNQAIVQRSLGAVSEYQAKASYVWGALLKNVIPLVVAVPGLIALVKFPGLRDGDHAFPTLVAHFLPTGLKGLFLAAFVAALMSSVDSYLNSAATVLTSDFYRRLWCPTATEHELLRVGRLSTAGLMAWGIFFAFAAARMESGIYAIFQTMMALFQGPALAMLLSGLLWRRATGKAALGGFLAGIGTSVALYALNQPSVRGLLGVEPLFRISEPFLYFSVWSFLVALLVIVVVSPLTAAEPPEKTRFVVYRQAERGAA